MEDVGHDYFMELYWRSFFQDVQRDEFGDIQKFKIHDLIHDLAKLVSGGEHILVKNNNDLKNINFKRTRHASFEVEHVSQWEIPTSEIETKKVRSLLFPLQKLYFHRSLNKQVFGMIISCFAHLRVLNLTYAGIFVVPKTIDRLKHLRYLDLSHNILIMLLPNSITKLKSLQTLDLSYCCFLQKLPRNMSDLVNLRHLCISECNSISYMPQGLSKLTSLQTMNLFVLGKKYGSGFDELEGLYNLKGELVIKGLEFLRCNRTKALSSRKAKLEKKQGLQKLELYWDSFNLEIDEAESHVDETVLKELQPHSNIRILRINGYNGLRLSNWLNSLSNLVEISIINCQRLQYLPQFDQFPLLQSLHLEGLTHLEFIVNISETLLCSSTATAIFFPSLQKLSLVNLTQLKKWWMVDQERRQSLKTINDYCYDHEMPWKAFGSLRSLSICRLSGFASLPDGLQYVSTLQILELSHCENLETLPEWIGNLTSLLVLNIRYCRKLKSLPYGLRCLASLQKLQIYECHEDIEERCKRESGEYWSLIAHIPTLIIT